MNHRRFHPRRGQPLPPRIVQEYGADQVRHAQLLDALMRQGLGLHDLTELIDLRVRTGRARRAAT